MTPTRSEWLDNCIVTMLAGKTAPTPSQWGAPGEITSLDVDVLRQAAQLVSLRPELAQPDAGFVERLRERMLAEAAQEK